MEWTSIVVTLALSSAITGCAGRSGMERLSQARHVSADLLVQFTRAADASNKAVMADTDEASVAFAREAEQAKQAVQADVDTLRPTLDELGYAEESSLLQQFGTRFAEYRELDARILVLAVENTNLKAQRLSFGPAQEAADAFRESLEAVAPLDAAEDNWSVRALVATAVASVREIQALQAPHIATADDALMARLETRMAAAEAAARNALKTLGPLIQPSSRVHHAAASAALDRFMTANAEIVALSRRNTNVRSLALSLNEKGKLTRDCEKSLIDLRDALARRGFTATR